MTNVIPEHPLDVFEALLSEHGVEPSVLDASAEAHNRWRKRMAESLKWYAIEEGKHGR